jgi:4-carboxymuconolactone decarboxylase
MTERYKKGMEEMRRHLGDKADEYVEAINEIAPLFSKVNVEFAFGDLYANESTLSQKTRELITIGALTVQGFSLPQLEIHIEAALRCGAMKEEIVEVITQMLAYCGFPAATNAIMCAKKVFNKRQNDS